MAQLKNTTVNGSLSVSGGITTDSALTGNSLKVEGGSVEIHGTTSVTTPYIDFHYGTSTSDYTSRIIENASGELTVNGTKFVDNVVYANHVVVPNDYSIRSFDTDGTERGLAYLSSSNNLMLGVYGDETGHTGHTYVNAYNGNVYLRNAKRSLNWRAYATENADTIFSTGADSVALCGSSSYRWYRLYAASATVLTSDEREKADIMAIADYPATYSRDGAANILEQLFDKLEPKTYTLNVENTNELHIGFIAQDVVQVMEELGLSEDDLSFLIHDHWIDEKTGEEKDRYGLAYEEFIALNTYMIQKQKAKIKEQDERISSLEERLAKLEALIDA